LPAQWQEFRGPNGSGIAATRDLPLEWSEANFRWQTEIPGRGWSSPVLADNQVWVTTAVEVAADPKTAAERLQALPPGTSPGLEVKARVTLLAVCVDVDSGALVHSIELFRLELPPPIHALNSFASPTPAIDGGLVYCHFGTMGTACVERETGRIVWQTQDLKLDHETGPGSSPIIVENLLIVHCDGIDTQFIVALDKMTGREMWRQERSGTMESQGMMRKAFSTPTLVPTPDGPQLLSPAANWLYAYDPQAGDELWKLSYDKLGFSTVPRPIYDSGILYVCTGFNQSSLLAVRCGGRSKEEPGEVLWRYEAQVPTMPTPIVVDGLLFMVSDRGIATCLDAATGERKWQQRLGSEYSASPIFADGHLYFADRTGKVFLVMPQSTFRLVATQQLSAPLMATPAAGDRYLIFRAGNSLLRVQQAE
jgi:outer membrane protein assembly factor BamB